MQDMNANLAALIGSRICHDLISPIGAINNGLELLGMSGDATGPEMNLIGESVGNASARIRFFRVAFGAAGDQMMGPAEAQKVLADLYNNGRLQVDWTPDQPVRRSEVRLAFLATLCVETALPYGGKISISQDNAKWTISGIADRINLETPLWDMLASSHGAGNVQPAQVQFALLPLLARESGHRIHCQADENQVMLEF